MRSAIAAAVICAAASAALATSYDKEYWDTPALGNNNWTYWDEDYNGLSGEPTDHNKPMNYFAGGGVGGSGYVSGALGDMEPALAHSVSTFWPAYPGELFPDSPFPYVDLSIPGAAVSVWIKGGHGLGSAIDLAGGEIRFFIGYYDGKGTETLDDDEQAFYCTKDAFDFGDNVWDQTVVTLGGDLNWDTIAKVETTTDTKPTDLYDGPQQWGFCIHGVPLGESPGGGSLGFDRFEVTPEPGALVVLGVGALVLRRKRKP
ncbi:MAG: hypothetical protein QGG42_00055 [Phycisphaerae bacterium]|jgi:hypothetical protein|nr:hypothetical protein [Phycisphaerae bacterium]